MSYWVYRLCVCRRWRHNLDNLLCLRPVALFTKDSVCSSYLLSSSLKKKTIDFIHIFLGWTWRWKPRWLWKMTQQVGKKCQANKDVIWEVMRLIKYFDLFKMNLFVKKTFQYLQYIWNLFTVGIFKHWRSWMCCWLTWHHVHMSQVGLNQKLKHWRKNRSYIDIYFLVFSKIP